MITEKQSDSTEPAVSFKPGDVVSYSPADGWHCREGMAYVTDNGTALDTYWNFTGDSDSHALTCAELQTAKLLFNVGDYDALDVYSDSSRETWETYRPDDRGRIASQRGLREALYVRRGAKPDLATQIANAEEAVQQALSQVMSAERTLRFRQQELESLRQQAERA